MKIIIQNGKKELINELFVFVYILLIEIIVSFMSTGFVTVLFYFLIIDFCVVTAWLSEKTKKVSFLIMSATLSIFVLGFREMRVDDFAYSSIFSEIMNIGFLKEFTNTTIELGYLLLNQIVLLFSRDYGVLQLICAVMFIGIFYRAIYLFRDLISLPIAILVFHCYIYFSILQSALIRISIAVAITAISFYWLKEKNTKRFVIYTCIAALFHYSALINLIYLSFILLKNSPRNIFRKLSIISLAVVPICFVFIARVIVPILGSRYSNYGNVQNISISISDFDTLPVLILGLILLSNVKLENLFVYYILLYGTYLNSLCSVYSSLVGFGRVAYYFGTSMILLLGMIDKQQKNGSLKKIIIQCGIITYSIIYVSYTKMLNTGSIDNLIPYRNLFFKI